MTFSREQFDRAFNPRVVAVVGDKAMYNFPWLRAMKDFHGKLYSVQIDPTTISTIEAMGIRNVQSLLDIPEPVDYVLVAVPRHVVPRVLEDCLQHDVGAVTLFTAGFSETGEAEGKRLEQEIATIARRGNLPVIGPNCMGIANLSIGLRNFSSELAGPAGAGNVGFLGQSGTHTINFTQRACSRGVGISKAASYGNATVVDESDLLEYLRDDSATSIIAMYVEGVRDGRRFFDVLRKTTTTKPVVIWKGGLTDAGHRAIFSHTAALSTPTAVWQGMARQAGAIGAEGLDELVDIVMVLQSGKPATRFRAGLVAMTGGTSVAITDAFVREGLDVPLLSEESYRRLGEFFNIVGGSFPNPLDAGATIGRQAPVENLERLLDILDADEGLDVVVLDFCASMTADRWREAPEGMKYLLDVLARFMDRSNKPFAAILEPGHREVDVAEMRSNFAERRIPAFPSVERAAIALRKVIEDQRLRTGFDDIY